MRVALCQINTTIGDFESNTRKVIEFGRRAFEAGADLAVFPEMTLTGYPPRDLLERPGFANHCHRALNDVIAATRDFGEMGVAIGGIEPNSDTGRPLFNQAWILSGGRIVSSHQKSLLPSYDVFDEDRYFEPGESIATGTVRGRRIGVTICEDVLKDKGFRRNPRYRKNPVEAVAACRPELVINLSASPYSWGKGRLRLKILQQAAIENRLPIVLVNLVGGNDSLIFDGRSLVVSADGTLLAVGEAFAEDLLIVDVPGPEERAEPSPEAEGRLAHEEMVGVYGALTLGLRDYAKKCGFKKAVLGLSGGIDSAVAAVIAADALGPENVLGVYMPSRYSSERSRSNARAVASNLDIEWKEIPIDAVFQSYLDHLESGLEGLPGDSTEENLQARIRGNILMALSNRFGHLVLATGNKSEMAVGYCTLYGDMSGGLCVISDLYKTEVYRLAHFLNRGSIRVPQDTILRAPSAELKENQRDQDTLPSYEVLDSILRMYIDDIRDVDSIVAEGHDPVIVNDVIYRLELNEYKRQQAAPGLRVSWKAFGMGRRYPIARKVAHRVPRDPGAVPADSSL